MRYSTIFIAFFTEEIYLAFAKVLHSTGVSIIITPVWINKISRPTFDLENLGAVARQDLVMASLQKETLDR
jgi:hypothetical protein